MESTVETLGPTRVKLAVEVPYAELEPVLKKAYRDVAQQVDIPGFRRGKAPAAVIDQRLGKGVVLNEAVQEAIPQQLVAAIREHEVKTLGRPQVENVEVADGEPLRFTAEVDVRPEIELPDLGEIAVTVDEATVDESDVDEQVDSLRQRFATLKGVERPVATGDYVQIDLSATVDGEEIEGGSASNLSYEVGSGTLVDGLDDALVGLSVDESRTFPTSLVAGEHAGKEAQVEVTVRAVKEKELPALDDSFAQMASEFDTLEELREDARARLRRSKRSEQLSGARDQVLEQLVERTGVPAPEGVVRDEVENRKQHLTQELDQIGSTLEQYLEFEGKTPEEFERELTEATETGLRHQLLLDTLADAEQVQPSDEEFGQEVVRRAQQAGTPPQQFYDQLVREGQAASVFADVRRDKALRLLLERVTITDTAGNPVTLEEPAAEQQGAAGGAGEPGAADGDVVEGDVVDAADAQVAGEDAAGDEGYEEAASGTAARTAND